MVTDNLFCLFYRLAFDHASPQDAGTDDEGLHGTAVSCRLQMLKLTFYFSDCE